MSIKPIDLQVNMNSTLELSKSEGAKLAKLENDQRFLDDKLNKQYDNAEKRVNQINDLEAASKKENEMIRQYPDSSAGGKQKQRKKPKDKENKDQARPAPSDTEKEPANPKRIDFLV